MQEKRYQSSGTGCLYCVAMPIGNALDLSLRAKKILAEADVIAAEDTRKLRDWLRRANVKSQAKILAYHAHNEKDSAQGLLQLLRQGQNVALVSDAGTPRLSDPGFSLVSLAHQEKIPLAAIPGPSALTALVSISPLPTEPLLFLGFLSSKNGRRKNTLLRYQDFSGTIALYESVHRVRALMEEICLIYNNPQVFIGRELTKEHQEYFWGSCRDALPWLLDKKGEFSILVQKEKGVYEHDGSCKAADDNKENKKQRKNKKK